MPSKHRPRGIGDRATVADYPTVAAQWHPTLNGAVRPRDVSRASSVRRWWKCPKGPDHEWLARPGTRIGLGAGCPFCSGYSVAPSTSLARRHPKLAREWHPTKNERTAGEVHPGTNVTYWWKCPKGPDHEWKVAVAYRVRTRQGCPFCDGKRVSVTNCLARVNAAVATEWHPTRNRPLTPRDVTPHTSTKVWWRCRKNPRHVWCAAVNMRAGPRETGCPACWVAMRKPVLQRLAKERMASRRKGGAKQP